MTTKHFNALIIMANEIQSTAQLLNISFNNKVSNTINGKNTPILVNENNGDASFQKSTPDLKNPFGTWLNFIPDNGTDIEIDSGLVPTTELTISLWAATTRNTDNPIFSFFDLEGTFVESIQLPSPEVPLFIWQTKKGGASQATRINLTPNQAIGWSNWTIVKTADQQTATISLYRNGVFLKTVPLALNVTREEMGSKPLSVIIGRNVKTNEPWAGKLAHLRMWSTALTEFEVAQQHNLDIMDVPYVGNPLQAYFKMDQIQNQQIPNQLGDGMMATIANYTDGTLVTHPSGDQFSSSLQLTPGPIETAQALILPSAAFIHIEKQLTVDFWIKLGAADQPYELIDLGAFEEEDTDISITYNNLGKQELIFSIDDPKNSVNSGSNSYNLADKQWHHIALVFDQMTQTAIMYVGGRKFGKTLKSTLKVGLLDSIVLPNAKMTDGVVNIALVRIWNTALTQTQVHELVKADEGLTPAVASGILPSPIAFTLQDKDEQPAIYITDQANNNTATLEITNTGNQDLILPTITAGKDYHIELRFRGGTLLNGGQDTDGKALIKLDTANSSSNWKMKEDAIVHTDGSVGLQFYCTAAMTLHHGDQTKPIKLVLQYVRADAGADGTRGTRIQLHYRNILIDKKAVEGDLLQYLNVINHQGKAHLPMHSYLPTNSVLNDGSKNDLTVYLTNTQPLNQKAGAVTFKKGNGSTIPSSKITLRFDQGTAPWMLLDQKPTLYPTLSLQKQVAKGQVAEKFVLDTTDGGKSEGLTKTWVFMPDPKGKDITLHPQEQLLLTITGLATTKPAGEAYLHIDYEDVEGYWDSNAQVAVQKSPIVMKQVDAEAVVSVGKNTNTLHVKTGLKVDGPLIADGGISTTFFTANKRMEAEGELLVKGEAVMQKSLEVDGQLTAKNIMLASNAVTAFPIGTIMLCSIYEPMNTSSSPLSYQTVFGEWVSIEKDQDLGIQSQVHLAFYQYLYDQLWRDPKFRKQKKIAFTFNETILGYARLQNVNSDRENGWIDVVGCTPFSIKVK